MTDEPETTVKLVLDWTGSGESAGLRRNETGFGQVKQLAQKASKEKPLVLNAFLYAFLCPAKNFDLFLREDIGDIANDIEDIDKKMGELADFEREAFDKPEEDLLKSYLALRKVISRRTARDERRALSVLLFSGPSTSMQIAEDLGIGNNLAERVLQAITPPISHSNGQWALPTDTDTLAATLHLLRSTIGIDPVDVLKRRIAANKQEAA